MAVGLHGFRHQRWRTVDDVTLAGDLEQAKRLVAETTGRIPRSVSCPFGSYDRRVLALLRRLGFSRVYTVDRRPAREDAWLQPRFTVMSTDTPDDVLAHARISAAASVTRLAKSGFKRWR
jgi:peptidoglycan/xylan/chitin deacetylase (PgdA/CDA1 family)